ncbi:MAG: hypothetical protein IKI11_00725 [Neisseriaceae bacterium]|nr:hypothetical protein [Neisseriaceae bacterium]
MAIDFENDNPYAPPKSSGEIAYEGGINSQALQYLRSARKWALFVAIMSILSVVLFVISIFAEPVYIIAAVIVGAFAYFSLQYAQHANHIQTTHDNEQLLQCLSSSTRLLQVHAISIIISLMLTVIGIIAMFI